MTIGAGWRWGWLKLVPLSIASKSGVMGITRLLASEWAPHGISVNAIVPGYMATINTRRIQDDPVRNEQILARLPTGRWEPPEDFKGVVVFLASEASAYVRGDTIAVDGGWLTVTGEVWTRQGTMPFHDNPHLPLIEAFPTGIRENRPPDVDAEKGWRVQRIIDAVYRNRPSINGEQP